MNRELFNNTTFRRDSVPKYRCPRCDARLAMKNLVEKDTADTIIESARPDFENEWAKRVFKADFICTDKSCRETVFCVGRAFGSEQCWETEDGKCDTEFVDYLAPLFFNPNLVLFSVPENCPDSIKDRLNSSFNIFFASPSAALSEARVALERLLDAQLAPIMPVKNGNEKMPRPFHDRIEQFSGSAVQDALSETTTAVKRFMDTQNMPKTMPSENGSERDPRPPHDRIEQLPGDTPEDALSSARIAVKRLMHILGKNKSKRKKLPIHDRIAQLPRDDVKNTLWSINRLGNFGSHGNEITTADVLDCYEQFELALEKLYSTKDRKLASIAQDINSTNMPRSRHWILELDEE